MYDMLWEKVDELAGKIFEEKKHLKQPFSRDKNRHHLTLGGPGGQIVDTKSTFGSFFTWKIKVFNDGYKRPKVSSCFFLWRWDLHNMIDLNSYPTGFAYFVNRIWSTSFRFLFFQCEKGGFELDRCCDTFVSFWQHLDVLSHLTQFGQRSFWLFSHLKSH